MYTRNLELKNAILVVYKRECRRYLRYASFFKKEYPRSLANLAAHLQHDYMDKLDNILNYPAWGVEINENTVQHINLHKNFCEEVCRDIYGYPGQVKGK